MKPTNQQNKTSSTISDKRKKKKQPFPFGRCRVCNDIASGVHYGVITCEGCKSFFKRTTTYRISYRCYLGDKCLVNIDTRNQCKSCRLNKCLEKGMSIDSVRMGRIPNKIREEALRDSINTRLENVNNEENVSSHDECSSSDPPISVVPRSSSNIDTDPGNEDVDSSNSQETSCPPEISLPSDASIYCSDVVESILYLAGGQCDSLSTLRLPTIFHSPSAIRTNASSTDEDLLKNVSSNNENLTVSRYVSEIHENSLIDYLFDCNLRYSKKIITTVKYLLPRLCEPFLIYELDFEIMSFFRYLRLHMLHLYTKHTTEIRELVQRMLGLIEFDIKDYPGIHASDEEIWIGINQSIPHDVKHLHTFAQDIPGFNELNLNDFIRIMNNRIFDFWTIVHYPLFYQGESFVMMPNGIQYTRQTMNKIIGKLTTDTLHGFAERLHSLKITQIEHALLIPIILCQPDRQLKEPEAVHLIKHCYMYALYIQLCTTRTENEAKLLFDKILEIVHNIDELSTLCKQNIGAIALDKPNFCE